MPQFLLVIFGLRIVRFFFKIISSILLFVVGYCFITYYFNPEAFSNLTKVFEKFLS